MHLSDKALLVHLSVSQWQARKLDKEASKQIALANGAAQGVGNYHKSLLPTCDLHEQVIRRTTEIRKKFYRNTLPWGIEGTFILPSANYLAFMTDFRKEKAAWDQLVTKFLAVYDDAQQDAQRLLGGLYKPSDYPPLDTLKAKFRMELAILPVPTAGDFRVELADGEFATIQSEIEERVAESSKAAMKDVWDRLYEKVAWLSGRLADPKTTFHEKTYNEAKDLVGMLSRLNFTDDADLEQMRQEAEQKLFHCHPQALTLDPVLRSDTAAEAEAIRSKMEVFMEGLG